MGKNLIQQRRGKASGIFRSRSFRFAGEIKLPGFKGETMVKGKIKDIINSVGHSSPLAVIQYENNQISLFPAPEGVRVGEEVEHGSEAQMKIGNVLPLEKIPEGTSIFNIESNPGDGGKFVRSTGGFARVLARTEAGIQIEFPSKARKILNPKCRAIIGIVAGGGRKEKPLMKAGNMYHKRRATNRRYPQVSGVAMNAVAHPHGGSSSAHKGRPTISGKFAPPGRKVGSIRPRRTGRRRK